MHLPLNLQNQPLLDDLLRHYHNSKTPNQSQPRRPLRRRPQRLLSPPGTHWTPAEKERFFAAQAEHGLFAWERLAAAVRTRNVKQVKAFSARVRHETRKRTRAGKTSSISAPLATDRSATALPVVERAISKTSKQPAAAPSSPGPARQSTETAALRRSASLVSISSTVSSTSSSSSAPSSPSPSSSSSSSSLSLPSDQASPRHIMSSAGQIERTQQGHTDVSSERLHSNGQRRSDDIAQELSRLLDGAVCQQNVNETDLPSFDEDDLLG